MTITATNGIKTQQYIKPQGAKGKLVSSSIFPNVKDTKYNFNALKHGLQNEELNYTITKKKYIKTKYIKQGCFQKLLMLV